jgi:hypothetical protein
VVELRDIHVAHCTGCTKMTIEVPEPRSLDTLIRCLGNEMSGPLPQLTYEQGPLVHSAGSADGRMSDWWAATARSGWQADYSIIKRAATL